MYAQNNLCASNLNNTRADVKFYAKNGRDIDPTTVEMTIEKGLAQAVLLAILPFFLHFSDISCLGMFIGWKHCF